MDHENRSCNWWCRLHQSNFVRHLFASSEYKVVNVDVLTYAEPENLQMFPVTNYVFVRTDAGAGEDGRVFNEHEIDWGQFCRRVTRRQKHC